MKNERWFLRCIHGCKKSWAVDLEPRPNSIESAQGYCSRHTPCPHCGHVPQEHPRCKGYIIGHKIMGKVLMGKVYNVSLAPACDGRCTNAQGPSCDCLCGGANHGSGKLVEVLKPVRSSAPLTADELAAAEELRDMLRFERTPTGIQAVATGTLGRAIPDSKLRAKRAQSEKLLALEMPAIEARQGKLL